MRTVDRITPEITSMTMNSQDSCQFVLERINVPGSIILDRLQHTYKCGRARENEIVCLSLLVSRVHCTFFRSENELYVTDLKSANGLYINGERQQPFQTTRLQPDDVIGVGCPDVDISDNSMFAYKLHVVQLQVAETNHVAMDPSETLANVGSSDVFTKRKRRQENREALGVPRKIQKLGENSGESSRKGEPEETDENDIEIVHISLNNIAPEPSCSNYNKVARSVESNGRLSTGKHTNTDMSGVNHNAVDIKSKVESDDGSEEMLPPLSNGVKRANDSVFNKLAELSSISILRCPPTSEEKNLPNGKSAMNPGKIYNNNSAPEPSCSNYNNVARSVESNGRLSTGKHTNTDLSGVNHNAVDIMPRRKSDEDSEEMLSPLSNGAKTEIDSVFNKIAERPNISILRCPLASEEKNLPNGKSAKNPGKIYNNNSAPEPSCSNYNNVARSVESNGGLNTGKHTNISGVDHNAVVTKPMIVSDEMLLPQSNGVKGAKNSVFSKSAERSSKATLRGAQTPEEQNLPNGKSARSPGTSYNSHSVRPGNSSAKVATNAESVTRGGEQSPKQRDGSFNNLSKTVNSVFKTASLPQTSRDSYLPDGKSAKSPGTSYNSHSVRPGNSSAKVATNAESVTRGGEGSPKQRDGSFNNLSKTVNSVFKTASLPQTSRDSYLPDGKSAKSPGTSYNSHSVRPGNSSAKVATNAESVTRGGEQSPKQRDGSFNNLSKTVNSVLKTASLPQTSRDSYLPDGKSAKSPGTSYNSHSVRPGNSSAKVATNAESVTRGGEQSPKQRDGSFNNLSKTVNSVLKTASLPQTSRDSYLPDGKSAKSPGTSYNSHSVRPGNSSAKVATNAESVTRGGEGSPKQRDGSFNNLSKTVNSVLKAAPLSPNFIQGEDTLIKMEDELQLTDNEEETMCDLSANLVPLISPMKLKQVQQEPKTRFSEVDVVNLSDSEDDIFPCSQLFDVGFGMDASVKEEVKEEKEEPIEAENERLNRLEDDLVISLSDSEDEDNTWLRRLSQSQQLSEVSVKTEVVDEGFMDIDDGARASEIAADEYSSEDKVEKEIVPRVNGEETEIAPRVNEEEKYLDTSPNEEEKEREVRVNENEEEEEEDASLQDARQATIQRLLNSSVDKTKIRNRASSTVIDKRSSLSPRKRILFSTEREADGPVVIPAAEEAASSRRKKPLEKKIPEVDPPHLPTGRRSRCSTRAAAEPSTKKRVSAKERKEMKEKEKLEQYSREKEQKARKQNNKWADIPLPFSKAKASTSAPCFSGAPLTKEMKKEIVDSRKAKLKKLAMEKKQSSSESNNQEKKRIATKPKAKVSAKTRSDKLVEDTLSARKAVGATERSRSESRSRVASNVTSPKPNAAERMKAKDASKETPRCKSPSRNNLSGLGRIPKKRNAGDGKPAAEVPSEDATLAARMKEVMSIERKEKSRVEPSTSSVRTEPHASSKSNIKSSTGRPKKRVSFSTVIRTVHVYEIDDTNILRTLKGKDAPLPAKTPARSHQEISGNMKVNQFLLRIFSWSPVWLEEQQRLDRIPPVVRDEELHSMLTHYSSYLEYCNITVPLLLLETWSRLTKEFHSIEQDFRRRTVMCSIVEGSVQQDMVEPNLYMTNLMLEVLITKADLQKQAHPNFGDLVVLEYAKNHPKGQTFHRVFAYVTHMYQTMITPTTHYNRELVHYVRSPHTVITYTMKTKPLEPNILVNRVQRLRGVTYLRSDLRLVQALDFLHKSPLVSLILSPKTDTYHLPLPSTPEPLVTKDKLNQRQMDAVCKVTEAVVQKQAKMCFIQGPPGTGKTKVIANIVTQVLYGNRRYTSNSSHVKILVCAPSNAAIDEITLRLLAIRSNMTGRRFKMVRIGRANAIHPSVKDISIAELARREMKRELINSNHTVCSAESVEQEKAHLLSKMNALRCQMSNTRNLDETYVRHLRMKLEGVSTKYELLRRRRPLNDISVKETLKLQRAAENTILEHAEVITCTLNSCYNNQMESVFVPNKNSSISVCIVDEATQSCEAESLIPLMLGVNTLVLVGDPNQLPATVLSTRAKELGLDQSIFSRVQNAFEFHPNNPIIMLDTQYRMAQAIAHFPNNFFYGGRLKNAAPQIKNFPYHPYRILNLNNKQDTDSFTNTNEAKFVADLYLTMLTVANLDDWESISFGIITPYNNQKAAIQEKIDEITPLVPEDIRKKITCEVNTIDSFQGQERDVVILSCVRSEKIGFLSDKQRLCVALTRAKHSLIVCGNFTTGTKFVNDIMWRAMLSDARGRQMYFTVKAKPEPRHIHPHVVKSSALR